MNDPELERTLVTLEDLPVGMVDLGRSPTSVETCGMRTEMPDAGSIVPYRTAGAAFASPGQVVVPELFHKVVVAPPGEGAAILGHVRRNLDSCGSGGEVDGILETGVAELAVPALGDESVGRRLSIEVMATGVTMDIDVLYARRADTIVGMGVVVSGDRAGLLPALATTAMTEATAL